MARIHHLGDLSTKDASEISGKIFESIRIIGRDPVNQLYRAVSVTDDILERIVRTGTDRTIDESEWKKVVLDHLSKRSQECAPGEILAARFYTDSRGIWARDSNEIDEVVEDAYLRDERFPEARPSVLAFDRSLMVPTRETERYENLYRDTQILGSLDVNGLYDFKGDSREALTGIFLI